MFRFILALFRKPEKQKPVSPFKEWHMETTRHDRLGSQKKHAPSYFD